MVVSSHDVTPLRKLISASLPVFGSCARMIMLGTADRTGRIVAVRQGQLLATAFHPELTPDRRIHELFVDMVKG
jgi:glutamine amidotransferase PdxT